MYSDASQATEELLGPDDEIQLPDGSDVEDFADTTHVSRARVVAAFRESVQNMIDGDIEGLRALLDREPTLATARSERYHCATLLHYLGSNDTEVEVIPKNAAAIAKLLLERGAAVDASCKMYGGGPNQTPLALVATSGPPDRAGLTEGLIDALVAGGAVVNDGPSTSGTLGRAILYGNTSAIRALVKHGARAYDLPSAAAIGDIAYVEHELRKPEYVALSTDSPPNALREAFHNAATFGHFSLCEHFLALGIDVNVKDSESAAPHFTKRRSAIASIP